MATPGLFRKAACAAVGAAFTTVSSHPWVGFNVALPPRMLLLAGILRLPTASWRRHVCALRWVRVAAASAVDGGPFVIYKVDKL